MPRRSRRRNRNRGVTFQPHTPSTMRSKIASAIALALSAGSADIYAGGPLPVPCIANTCGTNGPSTWVTSGKATSTQSGNTLTVSQGTAQAILNWSSFNIGAGNKVIFNQPNASSIALNRIFQASPSSIFGELTANGQLYLINQNGFIFGQSAVVNTAGLLASSLNMSDQTFLNGILAPLQTGGKPALTSDGRSGVQDLAGNAVLDASGNPEPVQVVVQQGAQINVAPGGRILLAGSTVDNAGTLTAPNGQIVLAAGTNVYLQASANPNLRGLIVEVDGGNGTAGNELSGLLSVGTGNASLVGLMVNQNGRISATTTVSENGSVFLQAENAVTVGPGQLQQVAATPIHGGTVQLGPNSRIDILPDLTDPSTAVDAQTQIPSTVTITGEKIFMDGAHITAPGGALTVQASASGNGLLATEGNAQAQIRIDAGTTIDLSGSNSVLPMSANLVTFQLRSNELEDDPDQRTSPLRGDTITADVRDAKPPLVSAASWQAELDGLQRTVAQRTSAGGTASFQSEGDVVFANGASINVSGGSQTYQGGNIQTTELIGANHQLFNIETASATQAYTGVLNSTFTQNYNRYGVQITEQTPGLGQYQAGYVQGANAGTVQFISPVLAVNGTLTGNAVNGTQQRTAGMALGGQLQIGAPVVTDGVNPPLFFSPAVTFTSQAPTLSIEDGAPLVSQTLALPVSYLTSGGFTRTTIYGDSSVTLPAGLPLNLGGGGSLNVLAPIINIGSSISAVGGTISLQSVPTSLSQNVGLPRPGVTVGDNVTLDVSGQWTNDVLDPTAATQPILQNGGSISLTLQSLANSPPGALKLGNDVSLKANGGAWLSANEQLTAGSGGSITISAPVQQAALNVGSNTQLSAFGVNGQAGGTLVLQAPRLLITSGNGSSGTSWAPAQSVDDLNSPGGVFQIYAPLFSNDGFSSISLTATAPVAANATSKDVLTVAAGATIDAQTATWQLSPSFSRFNSASNVAAFASPTVLPEAQNPVFSKVSLNVVLDSSDFSELRPVGTLDVQAGASIIAQPGIKSGAVSGGEIDFSGYNISIDGAVRAPGGVITASLLGAELPPTSPTFQHPLFDLGNAGVLDVSGALVATPNKTGLALGQVLGGGSINLQGTTGGEVILSPGSLIDIAGASAALQIPSVNGLSGYLPEVVASGGGSLQIAGADSVVFLGQLTAAAGTGTLGPVQAGSLSLSLNTAVTNGYPTHPATIELVDTANSAGVIPTSGLAVLGVSQLMHSGIDSLSLTADDIEVNANAPLTLNRQLTLNSPAVSVNNGVAGQLSAPYIALGFSGQQLNGIPVTVGTGTLDLSAAQMTLYGNTVLQGVSKVKFVSQGDVQLEPVVQGATTPVGSLTLPGNLEIDAARIYPSTDPYTQEPTYTITSVGAGNTVLIGHQTSTLSGTPLSVGGSLLINADNIDNEGTIVAPFGSITLNANSKLTLGDGSVTSVSADGATLPFGQTALDGVEYIYNAVGVASAATASVSGIPVPQITLKAPIVNFAPKATVDLKGGGDLQAYEYQPGTGGQNDLLGQGKQPGLYAIIPGPQSAAPFDLQETPGSNLSPGESVYLTGVPGLANGTYTLLPARYGLLPGAFLVQAEPTFSSATTGQIGVLTDGTPVVAGYLTTGSTGLRQGPLYTGFAIYAGGNGPKSFGEQLATYTITDASQFFAAAAATTGGPRPVLPADAGTLIFSAGSQLTALGDVESAPGKGGLGATIEVSATDLTITSGSDSSNSSTSGVVLAANVVQTWAAGDLILGGQLAAASSNSASGASSAIPQLNLDVTAERVTVDSGASLSANEIIAVATQSIDVKSGATLMSTSASSGGPLSALPAQTAVTLIDTAHPNSPVAAPALLAVSDLRLPVVVRPTVAGASAGGTIDVEGTLQTRGAVALDAPTGIIVGGNIGGTGAAWSLNANSIAFVGGSGATPDAFNINSSLFDQIQQAGSLLISSAGSLDLVTPIVLGASGSNGTPTFSNLVLNVGSINNKSSGDSVLAAKTLVLAGTTAGTTSPTGGPGTLNLIANELDLGPGLLTVNGFGQTSATISGLVVGEGSGGLTVGGNLSIVAAALTGTGGSDSIIDAVGSLQFSGNGAKLTSIPLGGQLTLSGATLNVNGPIAVPGGNLALLSAGDIALGTNAVVSAAGANVTVEDLTEGGAGGNVFINAGGNLTLPAGASISVSGAGNSPAGSLSLTAAGTLTLGATLVGAGGENAAGGSFALDAGTLTGDLAAVASSLNSAGFTNAISVRARSGNLDLAAGTQLTSNSIALAADGGVVDIAGTLSAPSAALRGSIGVFGGLGVTLESGAALHSDGVGSSGLGGNIELATNNGSLSLLGGSISTSGASHPGTLVLQAPVLNGNDVAINGIIGTDVSQAGTVFVEPLQVFAFPGNGDLTGIQTSVINYMNAAAGNIAAHAGATPFIIRPAVELTAGSSSTGPTNLILNQSLDLSTWRFTQGEPASVVASGGAPIDLIVRATGSISLAQSVTDGIDVSNGIQGIDAAPVLLGGLSSTLRFVAGADLTSANPLAVVRGAAADLTVGAGTVVTTGTGNIDLIASRNVVFGGQGASVYTTGVPAVVDGVFLSAGSGNFRTLDFPMDGGSVTVSAGQDVTGFRTTESIATWQLRQGNGSNPAEWGVDLSEFAWNLGTLGGGDLRVSAGRDITNLTAASADSYVSVDSPTGVATEYASGGLNVVAGRNVATSQFFLADGLASLTAGGSFTSDLNNAAGLPVGSLIALQNAQVSLWARGNILLSEVLDPTFLPQPNVFSPTQSASAQLAGQFFNYGPDSALNVQSTAGSVTMNNDLSSAQALDAVANVDAGQLASATHVLPAKLRLISLTNDVTTPSGGGARETVLYPSSDGSLVVFAGRDIHGIGQGGGVIPLAMSDAPLNTIPTVAQPGQGTSVSIFAAAEDFNGDLHAGNTTAASVIAGRDIINLTLQVPEAAQVEAGRDISDLDFRGQNLNPSDMTVISAGRDLIWPSANSAPGVVLGGPGSLLLLAGRNIDLGDSNPGVRTVGNLLNANLPTSEGASITALAGVGTAPDYAGFYSTIIAPSAAYQQMLVSYVESLGGQSDLTVAQADTIFEGLSINQQRPLIDQVFFYALNQSGLQANQPHSQGYAQGYAAIDALFPESRTAIRAAGAPNPYQGDISLVFSGIYTLEGGDINLLVPGGKVDVGLANPPPNTGGVRDPSTLGIVARGTGDVNIYTQGDVLVSQSRLFTLGGGNILIWSDEGNIDAGNGAKSSLSVPPPQLSVDAAGNVHLVLVGAVAGSGIRTIQIDPNTPAGDVNLIAPAGFVNAGDAGIGAAGNINIAAVQVIGASNINFGGSATGVPAAVSNIGSVAVGAAAAASSATSQAAGAVSNANEAKEAAAPLADAAISWLDVFVTGLGEENCKPDDLECLKRQQK